MTPTGAARAEGAATERYTSPAGAGPGTTTVRQSGLAVWTATVALGGAGLTLMDLVLLERKYAYLRGGFLTDERLTGPGELAAFTALSLLSDVTVLALPAVLLLWLAARAGARSAAAAFVALSGATLPLLAWTAISYEIARYLGTDADLGLVFNLVGRNAAELLAVSAGHLERPALLAAVSLALVVAAAAGLQWIGRVRAPAPRLRVWGAALAIFVLGGVVQTAARVRSDVMEFGLSRKASGWMVGSLVQRATDVDGDGYGLLQRPPDPDLRDARVHPWAIDLPGNGLDENGVGGDLPPHLPDYGEPPAPTGEWRQRPNLLLVMLESVRADAVGARLDGRAVTPVLDALAAEGARASQAYSHNGFTYQSRHHLFSGSLANLRGPTTLVDDFRRHGYEIAYFSGQDEFFGGPALGVGAERADVFFHAPHAPERRYTRFTTPGSLALPFTEVERRVSEFLAARRTDRPLFLHVNFHDTHFPYHHEGVRPLVAGTIVPQGEIGPGTAAPLGRMYLNTVANVDAAVGRVLERLRRHAAGPTAVIVTSDHGESLFDDDEFLGHGLALTDAQTRVPFVVSGLPLRLREPFGQADVRDALWAALQAEDLSARPVIEGDGGPVFQYIGSVQVPRQLGLRTAGGEIVVDLRRPRVRFGGAWKSWSETSATERRQALDLVHLWERMRLAQERSRSAR